MGAPWVIHPRYPRPAIDQLKPRHRKYFLQPRRLLHQKSGYVPAWTAWRYRNGQQPWKAPANKIEHAASPRYTAKNGRQRYHICALPRNPAIDRVRPALQTVKEIFFGLYLHKF